MTLNFDYFNTLKNKNFSIKFSKDTVFEAQLVDIKNFSKDSSDKNNTSFSMLLKVNCSNIFEQNVYTIENEELGELSLFLVPISNDDNSVTYEAIFS